MGIFKFSMRMLVKDYKKSLFYGITLIFAVAVCFVFFNIINNPDLADQAIARSGGTWSDVQMPFSSVSSTNLTPPVLDILGPYISPFSNYNSAYIQAQ